MNPSQRLQAVIKARLEGETFGWGPILLVWAGVVALRTSAEAFVGPTLVGGTLAAGLALGFQGWWPRRKGAPAASRGWTLQGLWLLVAATTCFLGSLAPAWGLLTPLAGAVLELIFLAGGLAQTGMMRSQPSLVWGAALLASTSVVIAAFPPALTVRSVAVALLVGLPALWVTRRDARLSPKD